MVKALALLLAALAWAAQSPCGAAPAWGIGVPKAVRAAAPRSHSGGGPEAGRAALRPGAVRAVAGKPRWGPRQSMLPPSLAQIQHYAHSPGPYRDVIVTTAEVNTYAAGAGADRLPRGVSQVVIASEAGVVSGTALVDFDQMGHTSNPLLLVFNGQHRVAIRVQVDSATAPLAYLTVTQVCLDGVVLPDWLVDAADRAFVQPHHPGVARHFTVPLPAHATSVTVGHNQATVHYPGSPPPPVSRSH